MLGEECTNAWLRATCELSFLREVALSHILAYIRESREHLLCDVRECLTERCVGMLAITVDGARTCKAFNSPEAVHTRDFYTRTFLQ
jgi:hypothetical protein